MELSNEDLMDSHHRFNDKRRNFNGYSNFTRSLQEIAPVEVTPAVSSSAQPIVDTENVTIPPRVVSSSTITPVNPIPVLNIETATLPNSTNTSAPVNTSMATPMPAAVVETAPANSPVVTPPIMSSAPAPTTEQGGGGSGARQGDILGNKAVKCSSNYWILGIALGAIGGYLYAKSKNKEILKNVFLMSALGGGLGYGIDLITCERIKKLSIKPAAPSTTPPAQ